MSCPLYSLVFLSAFASHSPSLRHKAARQPTTPNSLPVLYDLRGTEARITLRGLRASVVDPYVFHYSMKKDIALPKLEGVAMAIVQEADPEGDAAWYVYLVNDTDKELSNVLISSRGYGTIKGEERSTSTMRHHLPVLQERNWARIERIVEEVFPLNNQYWLSFYADGTIHDRKFIFVPDSIHEENYTTVPLMGLRGVMIG